LSKDATYLVVNQDRRDLGSVGVGLYLDLVEHGFDMKMIAFYRHAFGGWRVADRKDVDEVLLVVAGDDVAAGYELPADAEFVAKYDPLSAAERRRADTLARRAGEDLGPDFEWQLVDVDRADGRKYLARHGADRKELDELARLRARGPETTVYLEPGG
jgi:hypothetical protein